MMSRHSRPPSLAWRLFDQGVMCVLLGWAILIPVLTIPPVNHGLAYASVFLNLAGAVQLQVGFWFRQLERRSC
jgi:hypothetical protein